MVFEIVGGYLLTKTNVGLACSLKWLELGRVFLHKEINVMWSLAQNLLKSEQKINSKSAHLIVKELEFGWIYI